jgi:hypothetical protein
VAMVGDDAHDAKTEQAVNITMADVARALPAKLPRSDFLIVVQIRTIDRYDNRISRKIRQFAVLAKPASTNTYSSLQCLIWKTRCSNHDGLLISPGQYCLECSELQRNQ